MRFPTSAEQHLRHRDLRIAWLLALLAWLGVVLIGGDLPLIQWSAGSPSFDFARDLSLLSDRLLWIGYAAMLWLLLLARRRREPEWLRLVITYGIVQFLTSGVLVHALKFAIGRVRPSLQNLTENMLSIGFVGDSSAHSLPSGHTTDLMISAVFIGFLLPRRWQRYGCIALAALLSGLRVILVKHWPSDVLAGVLLGGGCALLGLRVMMARTAKANAAALRRDTDHSIR